MTRPKLTPSLFAALRAVRDGKVTTSKQRLAMLDPVRLIEARPYSDKRKGWRWILTPAGVEALAQYEQENQ